MELKRGDKVRLRGFSATGVDVDKHVGFVSAIGNLIEIRLALNDAHILVRKSQIIKIKTTAFRIGDKVIAYDAIGWMLRECKGVVVDVLNSGSLMIDVGNDVRGCYHPMQCRREKKKIDEPKREKAW